MRGTVLSFDMTNNQGVVTGDADAHYKFTYGDWKSEGKPEPGAAVEFDCAADRAWDIRLAPTA